MLRNKQSETPVPLSVLVVTKNEQRNIKRCLEALHDFGEVIVVDSASADNTQKIAADCGIAVVDFNWSGTYPKKRQWCLDNLKLQFDWVFFVDADEVVTQALCGEIRSMFETGPPYAGYFVKGRYHWQGRDLKCGLKNNKLCLIDRRKIAFPVVEDLDMPGMGEIEGHYQPALKQAYKDEKIGQLKNVVSHYACEDSDSWLKRHERYADWEAAMNKKQAWPEETGVGRKLAKKCFRFLPFRPILAFLHSYVLKGGLLDGRAGFDFARSRGRYYQMIAKRG